jgi:hypothetical protein
VTIMVKCQLRVNIGVEWAYKFNVSAG